MPDRLRASRCPRCRRLVVPPASICPDHPVRMVDASLPPLGEVVSFTTLHSPPEGFRAPLHLALVELEGGARLFCHGTATEGVKIGSHVSVEAVDSRLFWRRAGASGERVGAIGKSVVKGLWNRRPRGED